MRFGDSIRKLLETYNNCLELLEVFRRRTDETTPESDAASLLQKSLKSDRDKIERRYASRLSKNGRRLADGDDKAKSTLRRTLKRLNAALVDLLHMGKHGDATLPYDALKRLSNSSRIDAVNAIDQLSHRLASAPSRRSLASSSGAASSSSSPGDGHRRRRASASDAGTERKDPGKRSSRKVSKEAAAASKKTHRASESKRDSRKLSKSVTSSSAATTQGGGSTGGSSGFTDSNAAAGKSNSITTDGSAGTTNAVTTTTAATGVSDAHSPAVSSSSSNNRDSTRPGTDTKSRINVSTGTGTSSDNSGDNSGDKKGDIDDVFPLRPRSPFRSHRFSRSVANRMSMMTISSVSTKLGEIPERRRLQRVHGSSAAESGSGDGSEYNVTPTYPLKPYRTPPGSRAKNGGFWGLFSRR